MRRQDLVLSSSAALASLLIERKLRAQAPSKAKEIAAATSAGAEELAGPAGGPWRRLFLDATVVEQQHELRWTTRQFQPNQLREDYKLRFWLRDAELFSYLPVAHDPKQPDLARFQLTGP